jgi:hypothetical protein
MIVSLLIVVVQKILARKHTASNGEELNLHAPEALAPLRHRLAAFIEGLHCS